MASILDILAQHAKIGKKKKNTQKNPQDYEKKALKVMVNLHVL